MCIVQKFGGSSLAGPDRLRRAATISGEAWRSGSRVVVVVSASGDTTDELLSLARQLAPHPSPRELDALLSTGEQQSAALMAIVLQSIGARARSFSGWQAGIHTDSEAGDAAIRSIQPGRLLRALDAGEIAVVSGFQGISAEGDITTLGRGGSDTTAVALAAVLEADRCEIYTDVDGIYTADPRVIPSAQKLEEIDSRDMLLLARHGSQVLHPRAVELAMEHDVELRLLSSFSASPGSAVRLLPETRRAPLAGVTRDEAASTVTLVGRAVGEATLPFLRVSLEHSGVPVLDAAAESGCAHLTVARAQLQSAMELVHRIVLGEPA